MCVCEKVCQARDSRWPYPCGLRGGEICSKRGSMKGENEEDEDDVLFPAWLLNNFCKCRKQSRISENE